MSLAMLLVLVREHRRAHTPPSTRAAEASHGTASDLMALAGMRRG